MQEMKDAMGDRYILTFTAPTSYWYLRHFDIKKSAEIADWINLMSYDLHGYVSLHDYLVSPNAKPNQNMG
jgi:chitinase